MKYSLILFFVTFTFFSSQGLTQEMINGKEWTWYQNQEFNFRIKIGGLHKARVIEKGQGEGFGRNLMVDTFTDTFEIYVDNILDSFYKVGPKSTFKSGSPDEWILNRYTQSILSSYPGKQKVSDAQFKGFPAKFLQVDGHWKFDTWIFVAKQKAYALIVFYKKNGKDFSEKQKQNDYYIGLALALITILFLLFWVFFSRPRLVRKRASLSEEQFKKKYEKSWPLRLASVFFLLTLFYLYFSFLPKAETGSTWKVTPKDAQIFFDSFELIAK